jgi:hypothetical protein
MAQDGGRRQSAALAQVLGKALQFDFHGRRGRALTFFRDRASLAQKPPQGTQRATEVRVTRSIILVSDLQILLSQLGKRTDAPPLQPTDQLRKDPEAVGDG